MVASIEEIVNNVKTVNNVAEAIGWNKGGAEYLVTGYKRIANEAGASRVSTQYGDIHIDFLVSDKPNFHDVEESVRKLGGRLKVENSTSNSYELGIYVPIRRKFSFPGSRTRKLQRYLAKEAMLSLAYEEKQENETGAATIKISTPDFEENFLYVRMVDALAKFYGYNGPDSYSLIQQDNLSFVQKLFNGLKGNLRK